MTATFTFENVLTHDIFIAVVLLVQLCVEVPQRNAACVGAGRLPDLQEFVEKNLSRLELEAAVRCVRTDKTENSTVHAQS